MKFTGRNNSFNGRTTSLNIRPTKLTKSLLLVASLGVCATVYQTTNVNDSRLISTVADTNLTLDATAIGATTQSATPAVIDTQDAVVHKPQSYIVRANDYAQLKQQLADMEIEPTHDLHIIKSVAVELTKAQVIALEQKLDVTISVNHAVETASNGNGGGQLQFQPEATVAEFVNAQQIQYNGVYGAGLTIGFIDTGLDHLHGNALDTNDFDKYWGTYDALNNTEHNYLREQNGHGTHVTSIAGNSEQDMYGRMYGIAPNALTVGIKAFDQYGQGTYADVIRGIQWSITKKDYLNLKVLNMSFSGPVQSYYWEDPMNQAVMAAWQAGIVVVVSAGNKGPEPMTIGVPGNNPYVITVGAMTDNYTPYNRSDDRLAYFSSTGPTVEGFVKPDVLAPGGHLSGLMASDTYIVTNHPEYHDGGGYFQMSGTSQAAAVISGTAALLMSQDSTLTPDDVKCRIMSSARTAMDASNNRAYSVFQQGSGVVDVAGALASTATGCANRGLDINADIAGTAHYKGPAQINANGDIAINDPVMQDIWNIPHNFHGTEGTQWKQDIKSGGNYTWSTLGSSGGSVWPDSVDMNSYLVEQADFETNSGFLWQQQMVATSGGSVWPDSVSTSSAIEVNSWVAQE